MTATTGSAGLLAKLDEIAQFAEDNSNAARNSDADTWAVHARKIREVAAALRLAAKPAEDVRGAACDCAAAAEGEWKGVHTPGCASIAHIGLLDKLSRSVQRLRSIAEEDMPPCLAISELDLIESRLAKLRATLSTTGQQKS